MSADDDRLAAELAEQAGELLLDLRAGGGDPGDLRKAGDRRSHEFLAAELAARRPGDAGWQRLARLPRLQYASEPLNTAASSRHQSR